MSSVFGQKIKQLRYKNAIKQIDLAARLGVSQGAITNWESGRAEPSHENITKLATIFRCSIDEIYDFEPVAGDMWDVYSKLKPEQVQTIRQMIMTMARMNDEEETAKRRDDLQVS